MPSITPDLLGTYTVEQANGDIAAVRGQHSYFDEALPQTDTTVVINTPASGHIKFSSAGHEKYASSDTNTYNTGRLSVVLSGTQLVNSTTPANLLVTQVAANIQYRVTGQVTWVQGATQSQQYMRFAGAVMSAGGITVWHAYDAGTSGNHVVMTNINADGSDVQNYGASGIPLNTASCWRFEGAVTFSNAALWGVQVRCSVAADPFTCYGPYSYLDLMPVT